MILKRLLLIFPALCMAAGSFGQFRALMEKKADVMISRSPGCPDLWVPGEQAENIPGSNQGRTDDPVTCVTRYDLQTNNSNQRRLYLFPDGTIGASAAWSDQDLDWTDRGTGYNYFDGSAWGTQPVSRVESMRTGWPEYHPFGPEGELILSHQASGPLVMNTRYVKGSGAWTEKQLPALPASIPMMFWPRVVTNGPSHTCIHVFVLTGPTANGGMVYNGMDGALVYSRSLDGGESWTEWSQLPGMTSAEYLNFDPDTYSFAEPRGDTLAFTAGNSYQDQFLMKSTDNGTTWTKTVIHHSLYNLGGIAPHWFYCPDGTMSVALDRKGMAHVVFGLMEDSGSRFGYSRPYSQGIVYWNENMPELRQDLDPDSLFANGQYVAWVKDTNVFYPPSGVNLAYYFTSLTSNPELVIDDHNRIFLAWAGATSLVDPNGYTLRHIFGRDGLVTPAGNVIWHNDTLVDLTGDWVQYQYAECMYPSASPTSDDDVYILFQKDEYGGAFVKYYNSHIITYPGQKGPDDNFITLRKWHKPTWTGVSLTHARPGFSVGQNFPNPFKGVTRFNVYLQYHGDLSLRVTNLTGQIQLAAEKKNVLPGVSQFVVDGSQLKPGVYFYTVRHGDQSITKKMVVSEW